jgi:hypothetical protein
VGISFDKVFGQLLGQLRMQVLLKETWVDLPVSVNGREIGECIYCGSRSCPLGTEHAVPYGLNGPWTLLKASCEACARITHRFERGVMRSLWQDIRNVLAMQSRRRDKRSPTLPLVVQSEGVRQIVQVPRAEFPTYLLMPVFPPPAVLWSKRLIEGVFTNVESIHLAGPTFKEASERYPSADFVGGHLNFSPEDFARTLAKIGLCAGIHVLGLGAFTRTPIRNVILGSDPHICHWVGSWYGETVNEARGLHAIKVQRSATGSEIHVIVRLFAQFGAPEHHIVLGNADPAFVASDQWPVTWR